MRAKLMAVTVLLAMLIVAGCDEGMEDEDQEEAEDMANVVPSVGTASPL